MDSLDLLSPARLPLVPPACLAPLESQLDRRYDNREIIVDDSQGPAYHEALAYQPDRASHRVTVALSRPDAQRAVHGRHPDLPVAHRVCLGVLGDGFDQGFRVVIKGDDLEADLR